MNTATPIRDNLELEQFKNYYIVHTGNNRSMRNMLLITVGLNTALRISGLLKLKWSDVYDSAHKKYFTHIELIEQKTKKTSKIFINKNILAELEVYRTYLNEQGSFDAEGYLFVGHNNRSLSRIQAYRIISNKS